MNEERNEKILKLLETGEYTVSDVARKFDLSSQTVSQIYKRLAGHYFSELKKLLVKVNHEEEKNKAKHTVKYRCSACEKEVTEDEGRISLCEECHHMQEAEGRMPHVTVPCKNCDVSFHPFRSVYYKNKQRSFFHSRKCFLDHVKKNKKK